jgi:hypothetical protein
MPSQSLSSTSHRSGDSETSCTHSVPDPTQLVRPSAQTPESPVSHATPASGHITVPLRMLNLQTPVSPTFDPVHSAVPIPGIIDPKG